MGWMVSAASEVLGLETRRQPDWFRDNEALLSPLIGKRNALFHNWLSLRKNSDRQRYVVQRQLVQKKVKSVKNQCCKTEKAENCQYFN